MAKHKKNYVDVSKPLKDPRFEKMALLRLKGANKTEAYQAVYPNASYDSARAEASQLIEAKYIDKRALHLLASQGLSEEKLARRLNELTDSEQDSTALQAVSKGFDLLGYGKQDKQDTQSYNPVQINIIIEKDKAQPTTIIDVTPSE